MAFVLEQKESYLWPVTVRIAQDGGRFRIFTFDVEFRRVSQARREELGRQLLRQKGRIEAGDMESEILTPRQIADELVMGWSGILDREEGESVPFSEATKAQLLNIGDVADAILAAWNESIPGAKVKN